MPKLFLNHPLGNWQPPVQSPKTSCSVNDTMIPVRKAETKRGPNPRVLGQKAAYACLRIRKILRPYRIFVADS